MSRLNPIWTAGRLNEALEGDGALYLGLTPDGRIETEDGSFGSSRDFRRQSDLLKRRTAGSATVHLIAGTEEFAVGLGQLPPLLAFLSINPEPWCVTSISYGAAESVGPFLDYVNPLWEWLVRAARAGKARIFPLGISRFLPRWQECSVDQQKIPLPQLVHGDQKGTPPWLRSTLDDFELSRIVPNVKSLADATAVAAGLMELHDITESHELAQSIEARGRHRAGDYWHAIHHRREPDIGNAKYWLRKVGTHPIHEELATASRGYLSAEVLTDQATELDKALQKLTPGDKWDPFAFADLCDLASRNQDLELTWTARRLQFLEMTLLLDHAYDDATTSAMPAG